MTQKRYSNFVRSKFHTETEKKQTKGAYVGSLNLELGQINEFSVTLIIIN